MAKKDNSSTSRLKQQLDTKESIFIQSVAASIALITHAWQRCKEAVNASAMKTLMGNLHHLAEQSAAAGFLEIAEIAQALEDTLSKLDITVALLDSHSEQTLDVFFLSLETAAHNIINKPLAINQPSRRASDAPLVLLMGDTQSIIYDISRQLNEQGVCTYLADTVEQLVPLIESLKPVVILIELAGTASGQNLSHIDQLKQRISEPPAIVIVAEQDDIFSRLNAARAGAAAYLTHPLSITETVDFIRSQQHRAEQSAYRVLLINDDAKSAEQPLLLMQQSGIKTCLLTDPANLLARLIEFQPELILIDLHMRETNGLEMAANIRHHYAYSSTAIVFWAEDKEYEQHRHTLSVAGEEVFTKSMALKELIAAIEVKVKRSRIIQEMMVRDGLTGLLNRSTLDEYLQREISKNKHHKNNFSYVMLDLDHFSAINEQFGYQVGDEVLKALGALFSRRLRAVDTAARFGGEEVALILPNTSAAQARLLVSELLRKFSTLKFGVHKDQFSVTFSAGIADFPNFNDLSALTSAANQALFLAKSEGRNRVRLASC